MSAAWGPGTPEYDARFGPLVNAIQREHPRCDGVLVDPPYVFIITENGTHATRYWMPETLDGDVGVGARVVLRPAPPNAPPL